MAPYLAFWFVLLVLAVGNGIAREATYGRVLSELAAHQVSTGTAIVLVTLAVWAFSRLRPFASARQAWAVGVAWLLATVAFEFLFGRYVVGHPWSALVADYNLAAGRTWPLFLAWLTVLPALLFRLRGRGGD